MFFYMQGDWTFYKHGCEGDEFVSVAVRTSGIQNQAY